MFSDIKQDGQGSDDGEIRLSSIAKGRALLWVVSHLGLDLPSCVGHSYDGAAALSSDRIGAAALILIDAPYAHFYHSTTDPCIV